jgi:hypothetical protein
MQSSLPIAPRSQSRFSIGRTSRAMSIKPPLSSRGTPYGRRRGKAAGRRKLLRLARRTAFELIEDQTSRSRSPKPMVRGLAVSCVCVGISAPLLRHRLRVAQPLVSVLAWQAPIALAFAFKQSRMRDVSIYALQMLAYVAHYEMPNDEPHELQSRIRVSYPVHIDRVIGLGEVPTIRLQRALGRRGGVGAHDIVFSCVHWTWFAMPHSALIYILLRHRRHFLRSALSMAAVFDAGLIFYWNAPTAPPWWAGLNGYIPPVRRVMVETGQQYWRRLWKPLYDSLAMSVRELDA